MLHFFPAFFLAIASRAAHSAPCAFAPSPQRAPPDAFSGAFYVSLLGNNSWSGTLPTPAPGGGDGPFLTPDAAAAAVQSLPRPLTSDVYVYLRAGTFYLNDTLALGPGSGGQPRDAPRPFCLDALEIPRPAFEQNADQVDDDIRPGHRPR